MPKNMSKKPTIAVLQQQIADLTDALQRERADVMNVRRQHGDQLAKLQTNAKTQVITDLLPVIDNFERALKHVPADLADNDYVKGVRGVVKQFEQTLEQIGVQRIKTVGEVFDPSLHQAISMEEANDPSQDLGGAQVEVVCEELQPGFRLGDQVIRHAMVKVKMEPAKNNEQVSKEIRDE